MNAPAKILRFGWRMEGAGQVINVETRLLARIGINDNYNLRLIEINAENLSSWLQ
jgi:hypothetical protein